ncbi:cysteine desulfurase family protein [Microvirga sp. W0021]|uniref:Cysteine desulfurase n=1 Tax=Hohaiivirga grylli TaxID=3133970 RepID=A0ABV0BIZ3_9HYPH
MADRRIYLDHNATSLIRPVAIDAMIHAMSLPGNASSVHTEGRTARAVLEKAREQVANLVGGRARNVYFTSGGTEANNAALSPTLRLSSKEHPASCLILGATEHPSVLQGHRFAAENVKILPVDENGIVVKSALSDLLKNIDGRAIVSIHMANNETGVIQPVQEIARTVHEHGGILHVDAVQAAGRMLIDLAELEADVLTLSAHKIGGPKGVGAIVLRSAATDLGGALIRGGGQERGIRSGTENIAAIAGFGAAAQEALDTLSDEQTRLLSLRSQLEKGILELAPDTVIIGQPVDRLCNTLSIALPNQRAETLLIAFDLAGIAVSSGSACSSGKVKRSHVLDAMGMDRSLSEGAIRVSLGWSSSEEDCISFLQAFEKVLKSLYTGR